MIITRIIDDQLDMIRQWHKACDTAFDTFGAVIDTSHSIINTCFRQYSNPDESRNTTTSRSSYPFVSRAVKTKPAVITGGTGGIGTAICKRLATDGNFVISTCIPEELEMAASWKTMMQDEGLEVDLLVCDVSDFRSCQDLAEQIESRYGHIQILVNAAGITRDAMLRKMDRSKWDSVINTNLHGVFNMTRSFIDGMIQQKYGRIINISSVNGQKGQFGQTNYSTAKAGMIGFSRSLALELADKGITVNCVCPGYVATPMVEAIREDILNGIIQQIPMGRLAKVDEIADAVAFLADKNSSYITGTEIAVNGGLWMG